MWIKTRGGTLHDATGGTIAGELQKANEGLYDLNLVRSGKSVTLVSALSGAELLAVFNVIETGLLEGKKLIQV